MVIYGSLTATESKFSHTIVLPQWEKLCIVDITSIRHTSMHVCKDNTHTVLIRHTGLK